MSQTTLLDHSHISAVASTTAHSMSNFFGQSVTTPSANTTLTATTPGEGNTKPRLVNVRQQVAAASSQPANSQAPDFEQVQVG